MSKFADTYSKYVAAAQADSEPFGFDIERMANMVPFLKFLYKDWWKVSVTGLDNLPKSGPALIVGNSGSVLPWPFLMLVYALMSDEDKPRRVSILCDMDWIDDERLHRSLLEVGFVPFSADHAKRLFAAGHTVAVFPEGIAGLTKPFSERYRLKPFDWTKFMPALEEKVPIYPLATVGCDEAVPVIANLDKMARFLNLPAYPVTPFFPWLPFPASMMSLPVHWRMHLLKSTPYKVETGRDGLENTAQKMASMMEGEVQAELNRMLRLKSR